MAQQIQLRRDTAANWTTANPTLALGEIGLEWDKKKLKIGDGATAWNDLKYFFSPNIRTAATTTVTLTAADNGNVILTTNNSGISLVIPAGLGVNFAVGIIHRGTGLITLNPASGVTVNNGGGYTKLSKGMSSLYSVAANDFEFGGATE